jgi:hypothetical protein
MCAVQIVTVNMYFVWIAICFIYLKYMWWQYLITFVISDCILKILHQAWKCAVSNRKKWRRHAGLEIAQVIGLYVVGLPNILQTTEHACFFSLHNYICGAKLEVKIQYTRNVPKFLLLSRLHWRQTYVCVNLCCLREADRVKLLSHSEHEKGFSPVWLLICRWSELDRVKLLSQSEHE